MTAEAWNNFVASSLRGSFLQSWEWGEIQEKLGVRIWRIEEQDAVALVLKRPQPFGRSWLYVPRGPVFNSPLDKGEIEGIWKALTQLAEEENSIFLRVDPAWSEIPPGLPLSREERWRKSEREVQPRNTLMLDLTKGEEELLTDMHHKTRYNIRLARKKGVEVRFSQDVKDIDHFLRLSKDVSERGVFSFHPDAYYRAILEVFGGDPTAPGLRGAARAEIALADFQGEILAAHIMVSFGDTVTYMHGASSSKSREVMAPQLLQWETIRRAKEKGFAKYDFFGIAPKGAAQHHPWAGITRFKLGFGGRREDYIGAYDYVLHDGMYHVFNAARRLKSLLR